MRPQRNRKRKKGGRKKELTEAEKFYPFQKGQSYTTEFLRDYQHLRVRTKIIRAGQTVRSEACKATHDFFQKRGFQYVHTPLITAADCEGAGEAFTVTNILGEHTKVEDIPKDDKGHVDYSKDFFGRLASLTVSGQLHVETYAHGLGSVYTFGPTFRAENSMTSRHLAEFWMIEPEVAFCEFSDVQDLAEDYLKYCLARFVKNCPEEIKFLGSRYGRKDNIAYLKSIIDKDFARVSYTEGVKDLVKEIESGKMLVIMSPTSWEETVKEIKEAKHVEQDCIKTLESWKSSGKIIIYDDKIRIEGFEVVGPKKAKKKFKGKRVFENAVYWGVDLSSEHEKYLTQHLTNRPTILYNYPKAIKSFYMKENKDSKTVQACDVLP
eukprot:UN06555